MNIDTDQTIKVRRWDLVTETEVWENIPLDELAASPYSRNMADVGLYFINQIRKEMKMETLPEEHLS